MQNRPAVANSEGPAFPNQPNAAVPLYNPPGEQSAPAAGEAQQANERARVDTELRIIKRQMERMNRTVDEFNAAAAHMSNRFYHKAEWNNAVDQFQSAIKAYFRNHKEPYLANNNFRKEQLQQAQLSFDDLTKKSNDIVSYKGERYIAMMVDATKRYAADLSTECGDISEDLRLAQRLLRDTAANTMGGREYEARLREERSRQDAIREEYEERISNLRVDYESRIATEREAQETVRESVSKHADEALREERELQEKLRCADRLESEKKYNTLTSRLEREITDHRQSRSEQGEAAGKNTLLLANNQELKEKNRAFLRGISSIASVMTTLKLVDSASSTLTPENVSVVAPMLKIMIEQAQQSATPLQNFIAPSVLNLPDNTSQSLESPRP